MAGIGLHTGCKGVSGYYYHFSVFGATITGCIDVCLEKKKGRFWGEAGADYLLSGSNEVNENVETVEWVLVVGLLWLGGNSW